MTSEPMSAARERVLDVAEQMFSERGYTAVTLRDIASELGMRQASLYHHAPGGKEALFVEVVERGMARHREGLNAAIDTAGSDLRAQLRGAADWLLSQPQVDMARMLHADMPAISEHTAQRLTIATYEALLTPIRLCFERASETGDTPPQQSILLAGSFVAIVELMHDVERVAHIPKQQLAYDMIEVLLNGVLPR